MNTVPHPPRSDWPALVRRPTAEVRALEPAVEAIMDDVRARGDDALRDLTRRFDGVALADLAVPAADLAAAADHVSDELKSAIRLAKGNIERFHARQMTAPERIETMPGVWCWRKNVPIERVGLYIPGGTAPLFSTVLMLGIPARIAGCAEVVLCTPPGPEGRVHPAILYTAHLLGIEQVFRVGGAQAIAAMAYGTECVPKVYKLFGPGNQYVTVAKLLAGRDGVAIDMPAGPTELAVIADASANPVFVAADLLSQAEHGTDSQVFLIATDADLIEKVHAEIARQLPELPRHAIAEQALENSTAVLVRDAAEAIDLANAYAAEHLILAVDRAEAMAEQIVNAGSVFLGHLAPESAGDYASGTNHTLPTDAAARAYSGVSVDSFVKKITFQSITEAGLRVLGPAVEVMAAAEGLDGHRLAVTRRLRALAEADAGGDAGGEANTPPKRTAHVHRQTKETDIRISLSLDGQGRADIHTGLGFFDHMLEQLARHSGCDLTIHVDGDLHIDAHHTMEDTALALGDAFRQALGDKRGIERYGFLLPMDDALAQVALDFSGRSWLVWDVAFAAPLLGTVPTEMFEHFFKSFADAAKCNLNIKAEGENDHHKIEAIFKAVAKSIRHAVRRDPARMDLLPTTKGVL